MIEKLDSETKKRVNKAIANIRLIATRVKRANVMDAVQRADSVANFLNEFRQFVNVYTSGNLSDLRHIPFTCDKETGERAAFIIKQADAIYNMLAQTKRKSYHAEYTQVWRVLEDIEAFTKFPYIEKSENATS